MKKKSLLLIALTAGSLVGLSLAAATKAGVFSCENCAEHPQDDLLIPLPKQHIAQLDYKELYDKARLITVKIIIANRSQGSGIIIQRQGQDYTVLTNEHVANKGISYKIKTHSGTEYEARPIDDLQEKNRYGGKDLALLEFSSTDGSIYQIAEPGDSLSLRENDYVFAAGYPADGDPDYEGGFVLYLGRVLLRLNKPLRRGYQIGITNNLEKGMSGGPLVNNKGQVVAISGRHKALWGEVRNCADISEYNNPACAHINEVRRAGVKVEPNSWTIPIEMFLEQAPPSLNLPSPSPFWMANKEKEKAESEWQKAILPENWIAVVSRWEKTLALLIQVPKEHPKYVEAQGKIKKYQQNLDYARDMVEKSKAAPEGLPDPYYAGLREAGEAGRTTQGKPPESERTPQDWREIAELWGKALRLMQTVPANHPLYQEAQKKMSQYQKNLEYAELRLSGTQ